MVDDKELIEVPAEQIEISLFDLLIIISNVRDFDITTQSMSIKLDKSDPYVKLLEDSTRELIEAIMNKLCDHVYNKTEKNTESLSKEGIDDLGFCANPYLERIEKTQSRLLSAIGLRNSNSFSGGYSAIQLFHISAETIKKDYLDGVCSALNDRKKITHDNDKINLILADFESDDDITSLNISIPSKHLDKIDIALKELCNLHSISSIYKSFKAYQEVLKVGKTVSNFILSADEIAHLSFLINNHFGGTSIPPNIVGAIQSLEIIKPIYNVTEFDIKNMLGTPYEGKVNFIKHNFSKSSSQFYKTMEGIGMVIGVYLDITSILDKTYSDLSQKTPKPKGAEEQKTQILKYKEALTQYFQLAARFEMPITEYSNCLGKLEESLSSKQIENGAKLKELIGSLKSIADTLKQKALVVNSLCEVSDFIKEIKEYLLTHKTENVFSFFGPKRVQILQEILNFFCSISQSGHTEEYTNFKGIVAKLQVIFEKNHYVQNFKEDSKSRGENLLKKIFLTYSKNIARYHQNDEITLSSTTAKN